MLKEKALSLLTIGELSKQLNMPRHQLQYAIDAGIIPDAANRIGGRRVFTAAEAKTAADILNKRRCAHASR